MQIKRILLLWAPLADYTVACFRELSRKQDVEIYLVYQAGEKNAPYAKFDLSFCKAAHAYDEPKEKELAAFCLSLKPDVIMMSSWNYKFYMGVAKKARQSGTYVISTFDGQWRSTLKQWIGMLSARIFLRPAIDNFFVPGDRQATFARKLGYKNPLQGYYCANTERFKDSASARENKFVFVGRLIPIKGLEYLLNAYKNYRSATAQPWDLEIYGNGDLKHLCENQEGIALHEFTQPAELSKRLSAARCLILPSLFEPWGLVVHEAALAGLSIIASSAVGASTNFIRNGQNGYVINPDEHSLLCAMLLISQAGVDKQNEMSSISKNLGFLWTTDKWANYVYDNMLIAENRFS